MDLNKRLKTTLIILIMVSILGALSIPGIPIGFATGRLYIGIPSIIILVTCFFGLPIGWIGFGEFKNSINVINAIKDGVTNVADLAANFGTSDRIMIGQLVTIFKKRYLVGYKLNNEKTEIVPIEKIERKKHKTVTFKCPACGASLLNSDAEGICTYCGTPYKKEAE